MFISIKDSNEYRMELLKWQNVYIRLKDLLDKKDGWEQEKADLETSWENIQMTIKKLYEQT